MNIYKSRFFWPVVLIFLVLLAILLFSILKTSKPNQPTSCAPTEQRYPKCGNKCGPVCTSGLYNCEKNQCINCENVDDIKCGDEQCCPKDQCITKDNVSCCSGTPCPSTTGGAPQCCGVGESCIAGSCVSSCGFDINGNAVSCKQGEECITVKNASDAVWLKFKNDFHDARKNGNTLYACATPNCQVTIDNQFPATVSSGKDTFSPCTKLLNKSTPSGDVGYCTSNDITDITNPYKCWSETTNNECTTVSGLKCQYKSIYDTSIQDMKNDSDNIFKYADNDPTVAYLGNFCGANKNSIIRFTQNSSKEGDCTVADCWQTMGIKNGIIDIVWDDKSKICTGLINCDDNIVDPQYLNTCNSLKTPTICTDSGSAFNCMSSDAEIVTNSTNRCITTSSNDCNTAITNNLKWCVRADGTGKCVENPKDCLNTNFDTLYTDASKCPEKYPLTYNIQDGSLGYYCGNDTNKCSATFQYQVFIENRTPFTYDLTYNDQWHENSCKGNSSVTTIPPFSSKPTTILSTCIGGYPPSPCDFYLAYSYEMGDKGLYTNITFRCREFNTEGYIVHLNDGYGEVATIVATAINDKSEFTQNVSCSVDAEHDLGYDGLEAAFRIVLYMKNTYAPPSSADIAFVCKQNDK